MDAVQAKERKTVAGKISISPKMREETLAAGEKQVKMREMTSLERYLAKKGEPFDHKGLARLYPDGKCFLPGG